MGKKKEERLKESSLIWLDEEEMSLLNQLVQLSTESKRIELKDMLNIIVELIKELSRDMQEISNPQELRRKILDPIKQSIERRRFPRIKKSLIAGFRKVETLKEYKEGLTENISLGGFKIEVPYLNTPLTINQVIEFTLKPDKSSSSPIKGIGRISWMRRRENSEGFDIGITITYLKEEDRKKLKTYFLEV